MREEVVNDILQIYPEVSEGKVNLSVRLAEGYIKTRLNIDELDSSHKDLLLEVSLWRFNMLGSEGISSESNSMTTSYLDNEPANIRKMINRLKRAQGI